MDYIDLVNCVQRHTKCSIAYCLRKKTDSSELPCRFKVPLPIQEKTTSEFEEINSKNGATQYRAKLVTKRNDSRLNSHQRLQLQGWHANCDIHITIDYHACVEYMAKYATKSETKSPALKEVLKTITKQTGPVTSTEKIFKKVMMKCLGERDFSAQETLHHLLSIKLHSSTYKVFYINLNGSRRLKLQPDSDSESVTDDSLIDTYAQREKFLETHPSIMNLNLITFVTKYKISKNKLDKQ